MPTSHEQCKTSPLWVSLFLLCCCLLPALPRRLSAVGIVCSLPFTSRASPLWQAKGSKGKKGRWKEVWKSGVYYSHAKYRYRRKKKGSGGEWRQLQNMNTGTEELQTRKGRVESRETCKTAVGNSEFFVSAENEVKKKKKEQ